jgi:hypothetical protein
MMPVLHGATTRPGVGEVVLRVLAAAGLAIDVYVHVDLSASYDANATVLSQGVLFRIEAAAAAVAALLVLLVRGRLVALLALLVAAGGVAAVVLTAVVDVGAVGPFPDMYEPIWYAEKTVSLVGEAVAALAALLLLLSRPGAHRPG